ncbi:phosphomannomutase [Vibrio sp. LQ2]|uniref:phosphomannomutase n=1 Tax=Vibrio TaxID=662 RepID=UPI001F4619E8|nr:MULTISPECIES: phosphomannomutase [Vibrio]MCE7622157.1 phosphomannomutase [Vibrio fluvialis]UPO64781.1 phosphoglucomutase/phosphomannomutase [Vibrio fluvialis]USP05277.1 phosphomannomutase [Vibrio sp. LQ2]
MLNTKQVIAKSGIQFGTSGARGLVTQFTPEACAAYTIAFVTSLKEVYQFKRIAIAIDNRPSSPKIAQSCIAALMNVGIEHVYYGVIPTPALAYSAMQEGIPCIMVTGSHIPFDRNGLKFYTPRGEITKSDEQLITNIDCEFEPPQDFPVLIISKNAAQQYIERYTSLFDSCFLSGKRIGIYEHSSAGRDLYPEIFGTLGAEVISLGRSNDFVPIDTEAVTDEDKSKAKSWSNQYQLDFIFSTDGDGDRPLVAGEDGEWLRGDILGFLAAQEMNVEAVAIPVSCNTIISKSSVFSTVVLTKIGSPFVINEFSNLTKQYSTVAGFEANGGFLLGTDISINSKCLKALPTRDAVLPALMVLSAGIEQGIAPLVKKVSTRYTDSDRIPNFSNQRSQEILTQSYGKERLLLSKLGYDSDIVSIDVIDGLRITLANNDVIHLRPSGNAPELRCYAESDTVEKAKSLVQTVLLKIKNISFS